MADLKERVDHALNEGRVMVLVGQVLFAYAFETVFEKTFTQLPQAAHAALLTACTLLVVSLALLMMPASFHCIVEDGQDSEGFHGFVSGLVSLALPIFGVSMALVFYVMSRRAVGPVWSAAFGGFVGGAALLFWEGLEHLHRRRPHPLRREMTR